MRRFLTTSLILLALAVSAAGVAPAAHAGSAPSGTECNPSADECATGLRCQPDVDNNTNTCQSDGSVTATNPETSAQTQAEKDAAAKIVADRDANRTENASWNLNFVVSWIVKLFAWLVGVAALTLNYSVAYNVVGMGQYVKGLTAIGTVWRILRDIGNILLIFGFLAIGISIIIDSEWYGGGKKLLPILLIAAVFTNFSLFAAEAVVDVGNLFATQIYKQINGGSLPALSDGFIGVASDLKNERISTLILNKVGLQTIYFGANGEVNTKIFEAGNSWLISFMSIILFIITAFVMFSLAFILISRFIVLILLIMVSPIGVAGMAVPGLQSWANKWWSTLFQQTITAPILLLMLYIALSVIADPLFLTGFGTTVKGGWIGWITGTSNLGGLASMLLSFLIAMGLLLAVVYFAKTLSAVGAGWATRYASKLSGATLLGAGLGRTTSFVGRNTLGRYGPKSFRNKSFDVRNTELFKSVKQYSGGLDLGKGAGKERSYKAVYDAKQKKRTDKRNEDDVKEAEKNTRITDITHSDARIRYDAVATEHAKQKAEIERLEKEKERRDKFSSPDSGEDLKLETARANFATIEKNLEVANTRLKETKAAHVASLRAEERTKEKISKMKEREEIEELRSKVKDLTDKSEKEAESKGEEKKESKKTEEKKEEKK